jgi:hypothetical protein
VRSRSLQNFVSPTAAAAASAKVEEQIITQPGLTINNSNNTRWRADHSPAKAHHLQQQQHQVRSKSHPSPGSPTTAATTPGEEETTAQPGFTIYGSNSIKWRVNYFPTVLHPQLLQYHLVNSWSDSIYFSPSPSATATSKYTGFYFTSNFSILSCKECLYMRKYFSVFSRRQALDMA